MHDAMANPELQVATSISGSSRRCHYRCKLLRCQNSVTMSCEDRGGEGRGVGEGGCAGEGRGASEGPDDEGADGECRGLREGRDDFSMVVSRASSSFARIRC